jgi:hypothetical protein
MIEFINCNNAVEKYIPFMGEQPESWTKPCGFWYAFGNQWPVFVREKGLYVFSLDYAYKVDIEEKSPKILTIQTIEELLIFDYYYGVSCEDEDEAMLSMTKRCINWREVAKNIDGIEIYNKQNAEMITHKHIIQPTDKNKETVLYMFNELNLNYELGVPEWYNEITWSIGSGCIWGNLKVNLTEFEDPDFVSIIDDLIMNF